MLHVLKITERPCSYRLQSVRQNDRFKTVGTLVVESVITYCFDIQTDNILANIYSELVLQAAA